MGHHNICTKPKGHHHTCGLGKTKTKADYNQMFPQLKYLFRRLIIAGFTLFGQKLVSSAVIHIFKKEMN